MSAGTSGSCCSSIARSTPRRSAPAFWFGRAAWRCPARSSRRMDSNACASRPRIPLLASTSYVVTLTSELKDVSGNALTNPGTISFTSGPGSDTTAPTVTASTPYYNQTEVGRRPVIRVGFSEMIDPISVTPASFYLYNYYTNALVRSTIAMAPDRSERDARAGRGARAALVLLLLRVAVHGYRREHRRPRRHLLPHRRGRRHAAARGRIDRSGERSDECSGQRAYSGCRVRAHRCRHQHRYSSARRWQAASRSTPIGSDSSSRPPPTWRSRPPIPCRSGHSGIRPGTRWQRL